MPAEGGAAAPGAPENVPAAGLAMGWDRPAGVGAFMSTRLGGLSVAPYAGWNLGDRVGDDPGLVKAHRDAFARITGAQPLWLNQVHGTRVVDAEDHMGGPAPQADASVATEPGIACTVQVADCLPVLMAAPDGRGVAAAHAGWRGLAAGVVEATLARLCERAQCAPGEVSVWLGPCIGPRRFEVGEDVLHAYSSATHFTPAPHHDGRLRWLADLPGLARQRLTAAGVRRVHGGHWCTVEDHRRFYSFRRDGVTGRLAASAWRCR